MQQSPIASDLLVFRRGSVPAGLSIVEVLIALAMTLIVLGVMIAVFGSASARMTESRARIELHNKLKPCETLLRSDLSEVTAEMRPGSTVTNGYFEIVEGPQFDAQSMGGPNAIFGDRDDIVAMTVRSGGVPFRGRWVNASGATIEIESNMAEIIWYTLPSGTAGPTGSFSVNVYRRVLLIRPDLTLQNTPLNVFFMQNDVSARIQGGTVVANSLQDLTKRENRFAHATGAFPHLLNRGLLAAFSLTQPNLAGVNPMLAEAAGRDLVANDVACFDLKVWSPDSQIRQSSPAADVTDQVSLTPNDSGAAYLAGAANVIGTGAFVDPGYSVNLGAAIDFETGALTQPQFSTWPSRLFLQVPLPTPIPANTDRVYDTFSTHYESNGIDDDGDGLVDEGIDGVNNSSAANVSFMGPDPGSKVDDEYEQEVAAPYPFPLRGVKVVLRAIHPETSQAHQVTVVQDFVRK